MLGGCSCPSFRRAAALALALAGAARAAAPAPAPAEARGEPRSTSYEQPSFFVHTWSVDDGTPANTAVGAVRRPDGYLWVATRAGLYRFDGARYRPFDAVSAAALPGVITPLVRLDRRGRLWFTKDNGVVVCISGDAARIYTDKDGLPVANAVTLAEDAEGAVWLSYAGAPLHRIHDGAVTSHAVPGGLPGETVPWLAEDAAGRIWFVRGRQAGLLRDGAPQVVHTLDHPVARPRIATARGDGVWISDGQEIWRCREGRPLESLGRIPSGHVKILHEDRRGYLWVGTDTDDPATGKLYAHAGRDFSPVPLDFPAVLHLSDDCEGNVWVSTRRTGLVQVRLRAVEMVNPAPQLPPQAVHSVCEDALGTRFAAGAYGLSRWRDGAWQRLDETSGWMGGEAKCVAPDAAGRVWIGTADGGLYRTQEQGFERADPPVEGIRAAVRALLPAANGDLWIGYAQPGLAARLRDGGLQRYAYPAPQGEVSAWAEDAQGAVWAATTDGALLRAGADGFEDQTPAAMVHAGPIRALHATPDGSLWIAYATRGLGWLRNGSFYLFGIGQGQPGEVVTQVISDQRGWLWCAGDWGIFRIWMEELLKAAATQSPTVRAVLCGRSEGWPLMQATKEVWPRAYRCRAGTLWLPMAGGLAVIHPELSFDAPPPPVVIERLSVNGKPLAEYDGYESPGGTNHEARLINLHGMTREIHLEPGVRLLSLEFSALTFQGRENVRFRYRLLGLDDNWVDAGPHPVAYFSQVRPGRYGFHVVGCNNEGVWNETGAYLGLTVAPYYWQTWWFRLLVVLAGATLVGGAVWLETRRRLQRKLERVERQRTLERERARIARDIHDDLGANLTHLNFLSQPPSGPPPGPEQTTGILNAIHENVRTLTHALDEIVWAVNPQYDTLRSLADYFGSYAQDFLEETPTVCRLDIPLDLPDLPITADTRHHLFLAMKEALNNIVKHAQAREARVALATGDGRLTLVVEDNGRGVPAEPAPGRPAGGNGLNNMRRRMGEIGGDCAIGGREGGGTRIVFSVPLAALEGRKARRRSRPRGGRFPEQSSERETRR